MDSEPIVSAVSVGRAAGNSHSPIVQPARADPGQGDCQCPIVSANLNLNSLALGLGLANHE
jgi:hypothetical protein